ncbi:MAG TPA: nitric-oxide reductase large subunit [Symbiobacteriaceae bacterium]|nr:nitric-oxide reductase large subunit [Symbiobacteriaceae bacterium]
MNDAKGTPNKLLKHVLLVTMLLAFTVMLVGGGWIYQNQAPIPEQVVGPDGTVLTTQAQIKGGQAVYQKYGLMDYGTVLGHGSYLGPDYTAEALNIMTVTLQEYWAQKLYGKSYGDLPEEQKAGADAKTKSDLKTNRYDESKKTLTLTEGQVKGLEAIRTHYRDYFVNGDIKASLPAGTISEAHMPATGRSYVAEGDQIRQISDFFAWTAWLSAANRPGLSYSYTNNWPYNPAAGNSATYGAIYWSALSVALLIAGLAAILWAQKKWKLEMEQSYVTFPKFDLSKLQVTPGQRKLGKYLLVVTLLFLVQSLLGGVLAHYYAEGSSFYGFDLPRILPFNIAKGWHLQLAVFWIATAWLAMGLYAAPAIAGEEPKGQGMLIDILFWALVVVVGGSLTGQWLGAKGYLGNMWWWFGHQGWEYLELGRIWQILLVAGLGIWLFILWRGLRGALKKETDKGGLIHLLLYTSIGIPLFYGFAFFINPDTSITYADYWRWWIIHLWVEGMFEVFAVVIIGYLMVAMKLVTAKSTVRALYFQLIILLGSGVLGTGHHYYWIGAPDMWIGLGAVFSALEVIPLTLLMVEAYEQYKMQKQGGIDFPYRGTFWFLVATAFWNLFGAGLLGFLINLPIVSYFQHGSWLTPTHGHGALMGVYGMLAIALLLYVLRNIVKPQAWSDKAVKISFWGLNIGLMGMIVITLMPIGFMQMFESFEHGFHVARDYSFYQKPLVNTLMWLRSLPDTVFLVPGILPLIVLTFRGLLNLRPVQKATGEAIVVHQVNHDEAAD